jgi:peptidyl-prolyl cis-trans isomerase C
LLFAALVHLLLAGGAFAQDTVIATVNGRSITESDMRLAEIDLAADLSSIAPENRRRVLFEYLIENQLLSEAAEQARLDQDAEVEAHLRYVRRRVLRDHFYDSRIATAVSESEARTLYQREVARVKPDEEIRARHILVETEQEARQMRSRIQGGASFAAVAQEVSRDPGTAASGGDLGYFTRGQLDDRFEEAVAKLQRGVLSDPIQTQFGWHLVLVEDKRVRPLPSFDELKGSIIALLVQRKALEQVADLRAKAKLELKDPRLGSMMTASAANPDPAGQPATSARPSAAAAPPAPLVAAATAASASAVTSMWNHNGSIMRLVTEGETTRILYDAPREGLAGLKIKNGTVLFTGTRSVNEFKGTATTFSSRCPPRDFQVSGQISSDQKQIVLKGQAPRFGSDCEASGVRDETLTFDSIRSGG